MWKPDSGSLFNKTHLLMQNVVFLCYSTILYKTSIKDKIHTNVFLGYQIKILQYSLLFKKKQQHLNMWSLSKQGDDFCILVWLTWVSQSHHLAALVMTLDQDRYRTLHAQSVNDYMRRLFSFWSWVIFFVWMFRRTPFDSGLWIWLTLICFVSWWWGGLWLMDGVQDISDRQLLIALKSRAAVSA